MGGDAIALYPSMDIIGTTEMVAKVVSESDVKFNNVNLEYLVVYLFLVLGEDELKENGLGEFVPRRAKWKDSRAKSLSSKINIEISNWSVNLDGISWEEKRILITLLIKVASFQFLQ